MTFRSELPTALVRRTPLRKVNQKKRNPLHEAFRVMPDGREICYTLGTVGQSHKGRKEYRRRINLMLERQKGQCCLWGYAPNCTGTLSREEATFEHEDGRGGGKRDDRIELPDGTWINGAAHLLCNQWKGSRRIPYNVPANSFAKER